MPLDDSLYRSESYSCSFELRCGMKALKGAKELIHVSHVESCAIVCNKVHSLLILLQSPKFNSSYRPFIREFPSVSNEIGEDCVHEPRISLTHNTFLNHSIDFAGRITFLETRYNALAE